MKATADRLDKSQLTYMTDYLVWWTESFQGVDKPETGKENDLVIITVCNKKCHRSIASRELILQSMKLRKQEIRCEVCRVAEDISHLANLCPNSCPECTWEGQEKKKCRKGCGCIWNTL